MVWEENKIKLLGITIDNELKFHGHIFYMCSKANKKLSVLCKLKNTLTFQQRRILFKSFFEAQFKYCSFISQLDFQIPRINTTLKGIEPVRYFGPVIWDNIPIEIKSIKKINTFKTEIRKWKPTNCSCRLCKTYVKDLGFINIRK